MLSGRIGSLKIQRKPCRVSQNRGYAVFHKIHNFSQKVLKMTPQISSKVTENPKYPYPGPSENTFNLEFEFLRFLSILGVILRCSKSDRLVVFWGLDQNAHQGGPKDLFLHPRTSKLSFSDTLQGQFLLNM